MPPLLSVTVSVPVSVPLDPGVNTTLIVQVLEPAKPGKQLLDWV
jgi:hypothetical protein